ncbi:MAG: MBL fold metallo-hydrolase [Streptosporangiaceae bacterium]
MRLQLCGVRGSTPAPGPEFVRYGGNTSCVALSGDEDLVPTLILDAGTGLRQVTPILNGEPFRGTIVLSHLHWDHVQGLPFFQGGDTEGADVTLLIPEQPGDAAAEDVLALSMSPPHFPITPSQLRGQWSFGMLPPGEMRAGQFTILALEIPHKGGTTYGYRVSDGRSAMAYLPDHCPTNLGPGPEGLGEYHEAALALAEGADALLHDASLLPAEVPSQASFGHAAADYAVGLGMRAGARRVVLFHHRPDRTDTELDKLAGRLADAPLPVVVAAEREVLIL